MHYIETADVAPVVLGFNTRTIMHRGVSDFNTVEQCAAETELSMIFLANFA